MNSQTSIVARNVRLQSWAQMIQECNARPEGMTVSEWCEHYGITKCDYYYRMRAVRKACLESVPQEVVHQAIVPVPQEIIAPIPETKTTEAIELIANGVTIKVTSQTSDELLKKVLGVLAHAE